MSNIIIIHGSYGNPGENWFPWLRTELEKLGHKVFVPEFPIPSTDMQDPAWGGHDLEKWMTKLDEYSKSIGKNTIFIAHSRGCVFLYHYLAKLLQPVSAAFLVGPWLKYRWYPKGWKKIDSFHRKSFDWKKIRQRTGYIEIYQSTNDDTPVSEGRELAKNLKAYLISEKNAGHFNIASYKRYKKFPLLLKNIKAFLKTTK